MEPHSVLDVEQPGPRTLPFTMDTYSAVIPSLGRAAADAADTLFG